MLNLRQIDKKFFLAGGYEHVSRDLEHLKSLGIRYILDLQFIPGDSELAMNFVREKGTANGINVDFIQMVDGEGNKDLDFIFDWGTARLEKAEEAYPDRRDKILVKCGAGISRSPAMLAHYYCIRDRKSYQESINYIRGQEKEYWQFGSSPNQIFTEYLRNKFK